MESTPIYDEYAPDGGNHPVIPEPYPEEVTRNTNELKTPVREMTDREHLEEQTAILRGIQELVGGFFNDMQSGKLNPMQMLMGVMKR